jgi:hypothetical protein
MVVMMRMILATICLGLLWTSCSSTCAQPKAPLLPKGGLPRDVTGVGETIEKAKVNAHQEAVKMVTAMMQNHDPPLHSFKIDEKYVRAHVVGKGSAGEDIKNEALDKAFKSWVLPFRTDNAWWADLARHDRAEDRQKITSFVGLGLSLLVLAGFAYVRLDDYTQRRYTTWLRVAGVGVMSLVVAGWWMVFRA